MRRRNQLTGILIALAVMGLVAGCGSNQPCNTDPAEVDTARSALESAEQGLQSAQSELAAAETRKRELSSQLDSLEDADALRQRLELLKKGSGR